LSRIILAISALFLREESRIMDSIYRKIIALQQTRKNFDFCICFQVNLCYRVFIPAVTVADLAASHSGSSLRHWPPGTNS
jgi:hypothetical protein